MGRYQWSHLNNQQIGKYAEYFVKMEFTMYGWQVYSTEVDDRGIDFVVRTNDGGFFEVQVKSVRKGRSSYIFMPKETFLLRQSLLAAVVIFVEGEPPSSYLIPSLSWQKVDGLLCSRDYEGGKSKPEWGLNLSAKNQNLLNAFRFDDMIDTLTQAEDAANDGADVIPRTWLQRRVDLDSGAKMDGSLEMLRDHMQPGDEIWSYDEPAPPGVNAGELGLAIVRGGRVVHRVMLGVH